MKDRFHVFLKNAFHVGVLLTLFIAPTQLSMQPRKGFHLSPADVALAFTAAVWLLDVVLRREWRRLRLPPLVQMLFVAVAGLSFFVAQDKAFAVKDIVQLVEFFIVGHIVFAAFLREQKDALRLSLTALFAATAINVGFAVVQYLSPGVDALGVRGTFGNRNVLGGYLALALPLFLGVALGVMPRLGQVWAKAAIGLAVGLVLAGGFLVNLSGASYFVVAGVLVCMAARYETNVAPTAFRFMGWTYMPTCRVPLLFIPVVVCLLIVQIHVLPNLPRENDIEHFRSLALYDVEGNVEKRYPEWQAAYSMAITHPWLGVGLGNYQKQVGQYYDSIPRRTGPTEPDIQNLYLVLLASAGFPALLLFITVLSGALRNARRAAAHGTGWLGLGVGGALLAFAFTAVWHPLLVRGIGLPLAFVLALSHVLCDTSENKNQMI